MAPPLNTARCRACPAEFTAQNWFEVVWTARELGWVVDKDETFVCPRHLEDPDVTTLKPGPGIKWLAFCHTCDWEEEFWTEDEAKAEKRKHDCDDWMETWPDVHLKSPQERLEERRRSEEYRIKRDEALRAEKEEVERRATYVASLEDEIVRLSALLDKKNSPWKRVFGRLTSRTSLPHRRRKT